MKKYVTKPSSSEIGSRRVGWLDYNRVIKIPELKKLMKANRLSVEDMGGLWIWEDDGKAFEIVNQYAE